MTRALSLWSCSMLLLISAWDVRASQLPSCGGDYYLKTALAQASRRARMAVEFEKVKRSEVADLELIVGKAEMNTVLARSLGAVGWMGLGAAGGAAIMLGVGAGGAAAGTLGGGMALNGFLVWGKGTMAFDKSEELRGLQEKHEGKRLEIVQRLDEGAGRAVITSRDLAQRVQMLSSTYESARGEVYKNSEQAQALVSKGMIRNALSGGTTDTAAVKFMRDEAKDLAEIYAAEADNLAKAAEELAAVCQKIDDELKLAQSQKGSRPRLSESGPQDPTSH